MISAMSGYTQNKEFSGFSSEHKMELLMQKLITAAVAEYTRFAASVRILSKPSSESNPIGLSVERKGPGTLKPLFRNCVSFSSF